MFVFIIERTQIFFCSVYIDGILRPISLIPKALWFANVRNNLVTGVLFQSSHFASCSVGISSASEHHGMPHRPIGRRANLSTYFEAGFMTKYYSQQSPDNPSRPDKHDDPDKPVDPRPFDPDPSPGDPIVDPADEPLL